MRKLVIVLVCLFGIVVLINAYTNDRPGALAPEETSEAGIEGEQRAR